MKRLSALVLIFAFLWACDEEATDKPHRRPLKAGAGEVLLDTPVGISQAGYAKSPVLGFKVPDNDPGSPFAGMFPASRGVQSAPRAKAVLLDDGVTQVAIARIDAIFTTDILVKRVVDLAKAELGLNLSGRLLLSATHTHATGCRFATSLEPGLLDSLDDGRQDAIAHGVDTFDPETTDRIARSVVRAIEAAAGNLRPAALGYARGLNEDGSYDRRCQDDALYGAGNIDRNVRLLRIDEVDEEGVPVAPMALLVNFAMHGTVYDQNNQHLSVEAPGYVEYKLAERFDHKVHVLFMQGTAGDVSPGGEGEGAQRMEDAGYRVAETAHRLFQAVTGAAEADFALPLQREIPIRVKNRRIPISHELLGYEVEQFHRDGAILCLQEYNNSCPDDGSDVPPASFVKASSCLAQALEGKGKYHTDLTAVRLGELTIATLPGEASSEVGRQVLELAEETGVGETLLYAYAQDHNGYILMPDDWLRGGYEPTISYWGWKFAPYLLEQVGDLFGELAGRKPVKRYAAPSVAYPEMSYEAVLPAASSQAPAVSAEPPATVSRMKPVSFEWFGGSPVLGLPRVSVERLAGDEYAPLRFKGWRPVDNFRFEIVTRYHSSPSYSTDPAATVREHLWSARWEVPPWVPEGLYRFKVTGATVAAVGGAPASYELTSAPVEVTAATLRYMNACDGDGALPSQDGDEDLDDYKELERVENYFRVVSGASKLEISVAAFYPQEEPVWDRRYTEGDDQLANFRAWSELGRPDFPVAGALRGRVRILRDGKEVDVVALSPVGASPGGAKVEPGCAANLDPRLPRLEAVYHAPGPGTYVVRAASGDIVDPYGNSTEAADSPPVVLP